MHGRAREEVVALRALSPMDVITQQPEDPIQPTDLLSHLFELSILPRESLLQLEHLLLRPGEVHDL